MKTQPDHEHSLEPDLLFAVIKKRYGHLLAKEQLEGVRCAVAGLREVPAPHPRHSSGQLQGCAWDSLGLENRFDTGIALTARFFALQSVEA